MTMRDLRLIIPICLIGLCAAASYLMCWDIGRKEGKRKAVLVEANTDTLDRRLRVLECMASWYAYPEHGRKTASGEIFDSTALTCAIYRPYLRHAGGWGARLLVRNSYNGRCVVVRITDAMPSKYAKEGRMLDLSRAAACSLGFVEQGITAVECWRW